MGSNKGYYVMVYDDIYIFDETEIRHKKTTVEIISYTNNLQMFELEMNNEVLQKLKLQKTYKKEKLDKNVNSTFFIAY